MREASWAGPALAVALACWASPAQADTLVSGNPANTFELTPYATGLSQPTGFAFLPDGRMVITQKGGDVVLRDTAGGRSVAGRFPVDTASEKGLLNVLVHPSFAQNRRLFFYYSLASASGGTNTDRHRVVSIVLGTNNQLDMASEQILVQGLRGPANHDGGALAIGNDGKLYIGVGDTGCNSNRPPEDLYTPTNFFATCLTNGNGKILRVNLDGSTPPDNPLVGMAQVSACGSACGVDPATLANAPARDQIWAWGFRNPWRFWIDPRTGNLWVGDVGEVTYEEVDVIPPNPTRRHFGWPWREGGRGHPVTKCRETVPNTGDCVEPVYYCRHDTGTAPVDGNCDSITGGVIVDACQWPITFRGRYYFADNSLARIDSLGVTADRMSVVAGSRQSFGTSSGTPTHMLVGPDGGLYWATLAGGTSGAIVRVFPRAPQSCTVPDAGSAGAGGVSGSAGNAGANGSAGATGGGGASGGAGTGGAVGGAGSAGASGAGGVVGAGGVSGSAPDASAAGAGGGSVGAASGGSSGTDGAGGGPASGGSSGAPSAGGVSGRSFDAGAGASGTNRGSNVFNEEGSSCACRTVGGQRSPANPRGAAILSLSALLCLVRRRARPSPAA